MQWTKSEPDRRWDQYFFFSLRILDDILFSTEIDNPQLFIDNKREFHLIGAIIFNILINPVLFVAVIHFLLL